MRNRLKALAVLSFTAAISGNLQAEAFTLSSTDIGHGEFMDSAQVFQGFGCEGGNSSPQLSWSGAPKGTKAFAIFAYDPDAPTGSGWWHWQAVNIPAKVTSLAAGAGTSDGSKMPKGSMQTENDYGVKGFGGACPPPKDGAHRYQFTVYALPQMLELPANPSAALTGFMVNANALGSATIEALYKRD